MATYYISPSGNDSTGSGTIGSPWRTLNRAWTAVAAGDTIYMRGGTYTYTSQQYLTGKNGTSGNTINVYAYTGEFPVITRGGSFDKSAGHHRGMVFLTANYSHWRGIRFTGMYTDDDQVDSGFLPYDCNNCTFELLQCDNNVSGMYMQGTCTGNLILNSDFHDNYSNYGGSNGSNSDGLATAYMLNTSTNNTIRGCRAWNNGDDGFDTFENLGFVTIENCWAWHNGYVNGTGTSAGDGVGFKLGSDFSDLQTNIVKRRVQNCIAWDNRNAGIHINEAEYACQVYNCTFYNNATQNMNFHYTNRNHVFRNVVSFGSPWDVAISANSSTLTSSYGTTGYADQTAGWTANASNADFVSVTPTGVSSAREADGSLPTITFLHLTTGSDLIDTGTDVGLPFSGSAPDRGAFEFGGAGTTSTTTTTTSVPPTSVPIVLGTFIRRGILASSKAGVPTTTTTTTSTTSTSTTTTTTSAPGANMDISTMSYDSLAFDFNSTVSFARSFFWKPDGTKLYVMDYFGTIHQFSVTGGDISTAVYDSVFYDVTAEGSQTYGLFFKPDGTTFWVVENENGNIRQYNCTTPWSLAVVTYAGVSFSVLADDTNVTGIWFRADGTRVYYVDATDQLIHERTLSTPWNVSTAGTVSSGSYAAQEPARGASVSISADGAKLYMIGYDNAAAYQYSLTTPFSVPTMVYDSKFKDLTPEAFGESPAYLQILGGKAYVLVGQFIRQYSITS